MCLLFSYIQSVMYLSIPSAFSIITTVPAGCFYVTCAWFWFIVLLLIALNEFSCLFQSSKCLLVMARLLFSFSAALRSESSCMDTLWRCCCCYSRALWCRCVHAKCSCCFSQCGNYPPSWVFLFYLEVINLRDFDIVCLIWIRLHIRCMLFESSLQ